MLKVFNAFQFVACFVAAPFGISWLSKQEFPLSGIAFYVSCLVYLVMFIMSVGMTYSAFEKEL